MPPLSAPLPTMTQTHHSYTIEDGLAHVDFERVQVWLASTYWSPNVDRAKVERAARHSALVVGAYGAPSAKGGKPEQVGYLRVVSDQTTFAWVCDVYVSEPHRGAGLARAMVGFAQAHPDLQGLRRWLLATLDAHAVYAGVGFEPLKNPERWMAYLPAGPPAV